MTRRKRITAYRSRHCWLVKINFRIGHAKKSLPKKKRSFVIKAQPCKVSHVCHNREREFVEQFLPFSVNQTWKLSRRKRNGQIWNSKVQWAGSPLWVRSCGEWPSQDAKIVSVLRSSQSLSAFNTGQAGQSAEVAGGQYVDNIVVTKDVHRWPALRRRSKDAPDQFLWEFDYTFRLFHLDATDSRIITLVPNGWPLRSPQRSEVWRSALAFFSDKIKTIFRSFESS